MFAVSDASSFRAVLADCGDGFDWRADVARSFWRGVPAFSVNGVAVEPAVVWPWSGRVSFASCLRGRGVEAEGVCRPAVVAGRASSWGLRVAFPLVETTVAAVPGRAFEARVGARDARVTLSGMAWDLVPDGDVLVRLPFWDGVFCGVGAFRGVPDTVAVIDVYEGDVRYGLG